MSFPFQKKKKDWESVLAGARHDVLHHLGRMVLSGQSGGGAAELAVIQSRRQ